MQIKVRKTTIQVKQGDRVTRTVPHTKYEVLLNDINLAEFDRYDRLWSSYYPCEHEVSDFVGKLMEATGLDTFEEIGPDIRKQALAKLTQEEKKALCIS